MRGNITQTVDIANPFADAENDAAIDQTVLLRDRAIATVVVLTAVVLVWQTS